MPALITHYLHALDVYDRTKGISDKQAFLLGAQGPDPLYFHRALPILQPGKSCRNVGTLLHRQMGDSLFSYFAEYLLAHMQDETARCYAMGFICHYSLDRCSHPYVYATERAIIENENAKYYRGYIHSRIEHFLDVIMLRSKTGELGNSFDPGVCVPHGKEMTACVAAELKYVIDCCKSEYIVSEKQLVQAINDTYRLQHFSRDRTGIKRMSTRMLEILAFQPSSLSTFVRPMTEDDKWDYSNYQKNEWKNPFDNKAQACDKSFFELFDSAVEDALSMIADFEERLAKGNSKIDFTGNLSFKTGLEILKPETEDE